MPRWEKVFSHNFFVSQFWKERDNDDEEELVDSREFFKSFDDN